MQEVRDEMKSSVWPEPRPEDDRCYCYHPQWAHESGFCSWDNYGETCDCRRYRNLAQIRRGRREERFWDTVGKWDD